MDDEPSVGMLPSGPWNLASLSRLPLLQIAFTSLFIALIPRYARPFIRNLKQTSKQGGKSKAQPEWDPWDLIWEAPPRPPVKVPFKPILSSAVLLLELFLLFLRSWPISYGPRDGIDSPGRSFFLSLAMTCMLSIEHAHEMPPSLVASAFYILFTLSEMKQSFVYLINGIMAAVALSALVISICLSIITFDDTLKPYVIDQLDQRQLASSWEKLSDGLWKRYLILWCNSILAIALKDEITNDDLNDMGPKYNSEILHKHFDSLWHKEDKASKWALAKTILRTFSWDFVLLFLPKLCYSVFIMSQPLLLKALLDAVTSGQITASTFTGIFGAAAVVYMGIALTGAAYNHLTCRVTTIVRGTFITALFRKSLRLSHEALEEDEVLTLISTDIEGLEGFIEVLPDVLSTVIEVCAATLMLWRLSGAASIMPLLPSLISSVLTPLSVRRSAEAQKAWNEKTSARVAATSNILKQLKGLKISGFESDMKGYIHDLRAAEIKTSQYERWARVTRHAISYICEAFAPVMAIAGVLFWNDEAESLDIKVAFTILSITSITAYHLAHLSMFFPALPRGYASTRRLQTFLLQSEIANDFSEDEYGEIVFRERLAPRSMAHAIELVKATVRFPGTEFGFRDLDLNIRSHLVTMLVGPVGAGKSTLLKVITGEIELVSGSVRLAFGAVAYCGQSAWLQNLSIRDNIISRSNFNPQWYAKVVYACALSEDFAQFAEGDATMAGNGGSALSGGQRQRIALARAVYSHLSAIIIDDILGTLDIVTSQTILVRLFGEEGLLRKLKTTVVMVTSSREHLRYAHDILTLTSEGAIEEHSQRQNRQLLPQSSHLLNWIQSGSNTGRPRRDGPRLETENPVSPKSAAKSHREYETRERGDFSLYMYYFNSAGLVFMVPWLLEMALTALSDRLPSIFLRFWMGKDPSDASFFFGYAFSGTGVLIMPPLTIGIFYLIIAPRSSMELHERLLQTTMRARLWFVTKTGSGSLINRFSTDMLTISQVLPRLFMQLSFMAFQVPIDVCLVALGGSYMFVILPISLVAIHLTQSFFLRASRQMSLLGLDTRAPLYNHFSEMAAGIQHIRAFRWQRDFIWQCLAYLDYSQRPYYYMFCMRWWLQLSADMMIVVFALIAVGCALYFPEKTSPAAVGLSMVTIITLGSRIRFFIDSWAQLESALGSISRIRDFTETAPIEVDVVTGEDIPDNWPQRGAIALQQVGASYNASDLYSPSVLHDVSLQIKHGDKVGIVGRTGSGKSSLMLTLLKFLDYSGNITIDGRNLESVPHNLIRQRIVSISQEDIEPAGSLRKNLAPFGGFNVDQQPSDAAMIAALTRARLWQTITARRCSLESDVSTLRLTAGQTQLLGVARAILRQEATRSPIVLMDEALSSVDHDTASLVQAAMLESFADCTVITIAHRLELVENCKLIIEMEEGRVVQTLDTREVTEAVSGG